MCFGLWQKKGPRTLIRVCPEAAWGGRSEHTWARAPSPCRQGLGISSGAAAVVSSRTHQLLAPRPRGRLIRAL